MLLIEEQIHDWQKSIQPLRDQAVKACAELFFANLNPNRVPSAAEVARAAQKAQDKACILLTADAVLANLPTGISDPRQQEALRTSWQSLMPHWNFPAPPAETAIAPWRLAIAGAVGSVLGMLVIGWLLDWLADQRATGVLLGAVIGAAGMVYAFCFVARSATIGRWIARVFGARQPAHYNRTSYAETIDLLVERWVDYGLLLLRNLASKPTEVTQHKVFDAALARAIVNLHGSTRDNVSIEAEAVLYEARRLGLQGIESLPRFVEEHRTEEETLLWDSELEKTYRGFGVIEPGDPVVIVEAPIIQDNVLLELGQVRKVRR